jgi:hypothetical protein
MPITSAEMALAIPSVLDEIVDSYDHVACPPIVPPERCNVKAGDVGRFCIYRNTYMEAFVPGSCRAFHIKALVKLQRVSKTWQAVATQLLWRSYANVENIESIMTSTSHNHWPENEQFTVSSKTKMPLWPLILN